MAALILSSGNGASLVGAQSSQPEGKPPGEWVLVGPSSDFRVGLFDVSPNWPGDQFIVAVAYGDIARSSDGGATWSQSHVGRPGFAPDALTAAPDTPSGRIVFAGGNSASTGEGPGVSRSVDGGATWARVLTFPGRDRSLQHAQWLNLSPSFAVDGYAIVAHNGALYRSRDFGATWETLYPVPGQRVQQVAFSPAFEIDRTIVVAAVTGTFPVPWDIDDHEHGSTHHERSAGVAVSTDGGNSWSVRSAGFDVAGESYRYVQQIAFSPTFAQDGTMFAFAWGPPTDGAPAEALFRSSDRGQSWLPVWQQAAGKDTLRFYGSFALSPSLDADGIGNVALPGLTSWNAGPHGGIPCQVLSTADGGTTWSTLVEGVDSPGCTYLKIAAGGPGGRVFFSTRQAIEGRGILPYRSFDDGASWELITPPVRGPVTGAWPSIVARDGTFFVGTEHGIWALGPSARLPAPPPLVATPTTS